MMPKNHEIDSGKIFAKEIFSNLWFRIPEYQRPYIWGDDEIDDLLDDLKFAHDEKPDQEYFFGSFVYQSKKADDTQQYQENDLLDGQQRMTTLLILFACIRDLSENYKVKKSCQRSIYQEGDDIDDIPERTRIVFAIRHEVQEFVDNFIKTKDGTVNEEELKLLSNQARDLSVKNMARAVLKIRKDLSEMIESKDPLNLDTFIKFIRNKVLLIFVATENLDDAFRLFTILNDRGIPLRNSDILKAQNLGSLTQDFEKEKYARLWEDAEGELGEDFDRFLNHIRTILLKDKARLNLLDEFENKIYHPREKDRATGKPKEPLLTKGAETFKFVNRYFDIYKKLHDGANYDQFAGCFRFDNLIQVMLIGLPSNDWLPPLMRYYERFKFNGLMEFLTQLDNRFSADWIAQYTPTKRIERMNEIIRTIETANGTNDVIDAVQEFSFDEEFFNQTIESAVYGRRFTRYLLLKLDYLYADHSCRMSFSSLSVEHVLPRTPNLDSQWCKDFTEEQRQELCDRLGNLVLITTRKNTSLGNLDYVEKKKRYFESRISTCPNSLRVLNKHEIWKPANLTKNHEKVLGELRKHYGYA